MRRQPSALAALVVVLVAFAVVLLGRRDGATNVDDYLYALQAGAYRDGVAGGPGALIDAWRAYGTSTPLVPMLALPLAWIDGDPDVLVLVQLLPLLALLVGTAGLAGQLGAGSRGRWMLAALVGVAAPVLGYAAMLHFALAASALAVLALWAYLRSDAFARPLPTAAFGAAIGLLAVSRVVAPIYVAALLVAVAVDVLARRRTERRAVVHAALAAFVAAVLAAPWWIVAGPTAWEYLTRAGFGESAFTSDAGPAQRAFDRLTWTATETGWLLSAVLVVLVAAALASIVRRRPGARPAAILLGAAGLALAGLATSTNAGTAFALPALCVSAPALAWGIASAGRAVGVVLTTAVVAAVALGDVALVGGLRSASVAGRALWTEGRPGTDQATAALGCRTCGAVVTDALARRVVARLGRAPVLLARSDALLNANSLRWAAEEARAPVTLVPAPVTVTSTTLQGMSRVVTGGTQAPYSATDGLALLLALRDARFRQVLVVRLSPGADVRVWAAPTDSGSR